MLAIGNPLGYGITLSDGIISALSRTVTVENTTMTLMQTTAAINSGNSGGGLFNMKGELIGITNAKVGGTSVEAMGYAIPAEKVIKCINDFSIFVTSFFLKIIVVLFPWLDVFIHIIPS